MRADYNLVDTKIMILCGGLGSRLKPVVPNTPKVLTNINGIPFLDSLILKFLKQGFQNFILCVGHMKEKIINHYSSDNNFNISFSTETYLLGTGGAIKNALPLVENSFFIAMNGDSYCDVNLMDLIKFHLKNDADISIVTSVSGSSRSDTGLIRINDSNKIISFKEKGANTGEYYLNAGIYVINKNIIDSYDSKLFSFEEDFLPELIKKNNIYGYKTINPIYDIGTPQRYQKFINLDIENI